MISLSVMSSSAAPSEWKDLVVDDVRFFSSPSCNGCRDLKEPKILDGLDFCRLRGRDLPKRLVLELVRSRFEAVEPLGDGGSGVKEESVLLFLNRSAGALSGGS